MEPDWHPETRVELVAMLEERDQELGFQRAIAACGRALLAAHSPERVNEAMEALLQATDVTSIFVEINVDDPDLGPCTSLIHEMSVPGVEIDRERWAMVPWSRKPNLHALLSRGRPSLLRLDQLGEVEAATYAGTRTKAEAHYPVVVGGRWAGTVGLSHQWSDRIWTDDDVRLLSAAADLFARLWEREEQTERLEVAVANAQKRYDYEWALASCSQALLSATDEHGLELALDALLQVTSAEYGTVERNVEHPDLGPCSQVLCRAEIPESGGSPFHEFDDYWFLVPWSRMPDSYAQLAKGLPFAFRISELGPVERQLYEGSPTPSGAEVDIPIMVDGDWRGLIAFGYRADDHNWDPGDVALFQTAADMVAAFWLREEAQDRLEKLIRSKDEFLASVSHELRTPLTTVVGLAEEMRDRADDFSAGERREFNALIAEQGLEMAQLVEDLLVAARVDAGGIEVEAVPVNLSREVARVVSGMRSHRAIAIRSNGECVAVAEAVRVRQILRNLLTNAVRYGGPSVRADCWTGDGVVVVAVSDDGPVIDTAARELIFEPYQRAHQEPTQPASVGLGLTVSRNLARLMGGDLRYLREAGRNVFELTLPARVTGESGGPGS